MFLTLSGTLEITGDSVLYTTRQSSEGETLQLGLYFTIQFLSYSQPYDAYCPHCSARLRLWPAKGIIWNRILLIILPLTGHPFYCDECPYEGDVLKPSTGQNRLNCFLCDFDCCVSCSNAGRFGLVGDVEQNIFPYRQPPVYPPLTPEGPTQQIYP